MKLRELKEQEPLEVIEVTKHTVPMLEPLEVSEVTKHTVPTFLNPTTDKIGRKTETVEKKRIQMRIFTDGEISKESEETTQNIEEYYIGKDKYQYDVDTLKTKNIYFKNHSYVITYLIAKELTTTGNVRGWFDVVKEVSIYLQNSKDKKSLKRAKQAIKEIANHNNSVDYFSPLGMLFSQGNKSETIETKKISKNVYSLTTQRK